METVITLIVGIAIVVACAYIVAALTIFICAIFGGIADENDSKNL